MIFHSLADSAIEVLDRINVVLVVQQLWPIYHRLWSRFTTFIFEEKKLDGDLAPYRMSRLFLKLQACRPRVERENK